jgi:hypothetical protein
VFPQHVQVHWSSHQLNVGLLAAGSQIPLARHCVQLFLQKAAPTDIRTTSE